MVNDTDLKYWLGLSLTRGLGPRTFQLLYNHYRSPRFVWEASRRELSCLGLPAPVAESLEESRKRIDLDQELQRVRNSGINLLTLEDANYPQNLKETDNPPFLLFVKGEIVARDNVAVAVVGTRRSSDYGRSVTRRLVADLALSGLTIVSGLALGIDSLAHRAALEAGGRTIAVLGHGLDQIYPPGNKGLAGEIISHGALVSEFPLGYPPVPGNFPARNRIISGLSLGTLVCEAPEKSGAMITAACALDQNREVFAIPGPIFNPGSQGPGRLIQNGAKLVLDAKDVLSELGMARKLGDRRQPEFAPENETEGLLVKILEGDSGGLPVDDIARRSKLSISVLSSTLIKLEMLGVVEEVSGGRWTVVR